MNLTNNKRIYTAKDLLAIIVIGVTATAFTLVDTIKSIDLGTTLPKGNYSATDVSGSKVTIGQAKDKKGLLVVFTSNSCTFATQSADRLRAITQYARNNKIGVVLVNSNEQFRDRDDSFTKMQENKTQRAYEGYYIVDVNSELADAFGATRTPECFLFNGSGTLVYKGAPDDNPSKTTSNTNYLQNALTSLVSGTAIQTTTTKPVGCEIKRKVN